MEIVRRFPQRSDGLGLPLSDPLGLVRAIYATCATIFAFPALSRSVDAFCERFMTVVTFCERLIHSQVDVDRISRLGHTWTISSSDPPSGPVLMGFEPIPVLMGSW